MPPVTAALRVLAQEGFAGPERPIEGERGFLRVMSEATTRRRCSIRTLASEWALLSNTYKPYPCGVVLNPSSRRAWGYRATPGFSFADVEA